MKWARVSGVALFVGAIAAALCAKPSGEVFPSGPSVPENLLRIELRLSSPLFSPLDVRHVHLFDGHGREMANVFLDLPLPSSDGTEVTILLDPARVKSGVPANVILGRSLHAGSFVTLVIDDPLLEKPVRRSWLVTGVDANGPQASRWIIITPDSGTLAPLLVQLDVPLGLSAEHWIAIRGPDGTRLAGRASLQKGESIWRFEPTKDWREGSYSLVIRTEIEDVAGNRLGAPFEGVRGSVIRPPFEFERPFRIRRGSN